VISHSRGLEFAVGSVLTSWKEIAQCLGKSVRTVQRWEGQFGLPVERLRGGKVRASRTKLDGWLNDNWVSTRQQIPPQIPVNGPSPYRNLVEECRQLRAENWELCKQLLENVQKLEKATERVWLIMCAENSEKIPVRKYIRKEPRQTDETHISPTRRGRVS
jgi:phage terminase Nu1 subunit (DNA packaging protein)